MTGPPLVRAGAAALGDALNDGHVIAVPGVGGYQLAARRGAPGVTILLALAAAAAGGHDVVPFVAIGRIAQAGDVTADWSEVIRRVAIRFWPGPLVLIVGDTDGSVRITMPPGRSLRVLCRRKGPLVMVAAHGADGRPLTDPERVRSAFDATEVALVVDGGTCEGPGPSVLDCRVAPPVVFEVGALPRTYIEAALIVGGRRRWRSRS
jgi:tRNA A37 threonylcarbamoyladenosine synthetase subunit TsaC/SUA5/YrdC